MSHKIDAELARAILAKATEMGMREDLPLPESDSAAIAEAELGISICEQHEQVALAVGKDKVPLWSKIEAVLMIVRGPEPPQLLQQPAAVPAPLPPPVQQPPQPAVSLPRVVAPVPAPPAPPAPLPDPRSFVERGDPVKGEVWRDANQAEWEVLSYSGGQTIEVRSVATGESTIGPAGMLKVRAREAPMPAAVDDDPAEQEMRAREDPANEPKLPPGESFARDIGLPPAPPSSEAPATVPVEVTPSVPVATPAPSAPEQSPMEVPDDEGDEVYARLLDDTERRYAPSGFPLPRELVAPPDGMPENLTDVTDPEARSLHSRYNALAALAKYRHDLESARARECATLRKLHLKPAMRDARRQLGKDATVTEVSQLAGDDESVSLWTVRMTAHEEEASAYKTFYEIYSEHVIVLSRDWTMRAKQESGS